MRVRRLILLATLAGAACTRAAPPPGGGAAPAPAAPPASIQTDRGAYTYQRGPQPPRGEVVMVAAYRNRGADTVYLALCDTRPPRYRLEKRVGGEWVRAYDPACDLVLRQNLPALAPGAVRVDTLRIADYAPGHPRLSVAEVAGTYRLVYEVYARRPSLAGSPPPRETVTSNAFEIRE